MLQSKMFKNGNMSAAGHDRPSSADNETAQNYLDNYRTLEIRTQVLQEEHQTAAGEHESLKKQLSAKEDALGTLKTEKDDCLDRLRKVQKEL